MLRAGPCRQARVFIHSDNRMSNASTEVRLPSWDEAVLGCLTRYQCPLRLATLYNDVRIHAPHLVNRNPNHYQDKIRQVVARLARNGQVVHVGKGVWRAA